MQEAVTGILADRAQQADGLNRMLVVSLAAHAALGAVLVLTPSWGASSRSAEPAGITISMAPDGPDTGGMTAIADRAVQAVAKPDAPRAAPVPPAAKAPEMVESTRAAKVPPSKQVAKPDASSKTRTPTTGAEIQTGSAQVKTGGAKIPFGGLASARGLGGSDIITDVQNFCCPVYLAQLIQQVKANWNASQGTAGQAVVRFTIRRDGAIVNPELTRSTGQDLLDLEARRAVIRTGQLAPLPREYTEPNLTIQLTFDYKR